MPPLLRDVLLNPQLEAVLDRRLLSLFKLLMGPPATLNLRNILWHGFATPELGIDSRYTNVLFAMVCTVGRNLRERKHAEFVSPRTLYDFSGLNCFLERELDSLDERFLDKIYFR